jgi:Protein of unknown function (DUF3592)
MPLPPLNRSKTGAWLLLGVALLFVAALSHEVAGLFRAVQAKAWPSVPSTITESRAVIGCGKGGSWYPVVRYRYSYNSQDYESTRLAFGNVGCGSEQDARNVAARYVPGQIVTAWVNPSVPSESTLIVGNVLGESWLGIAISSGFALTGLILGRSLLRQSAA